MNGAYVFYNPCVWEIHACSNNALSTPCLQGFLEPGSWKGFSRTILVGREALMAITKACLSCSIRGLLFHTKRGCSSVLSPYENANFFDRVVGTVLAWPQCFDCKFGLKSTELQKEKLNQKWSPVHARICASVPRAVGFAHGLSIARRIIHICAAEPSPNPSKSGNSLVLQRKDLAHPKFVAGKNLADLEPRPDLPFASRMQNGGLCCQKQTWHLKLVFRKDQLQISCLCLGGP